MSSPIFRCALFLALAAPATEHARGQDAPVELPLPTGSAPAADIINADPVARLERENWMSDDCDCCTCVVADRPFRLQVLGGAFFDGKVGPDNPRNANFNFDYAPITLRFSADRLLPRRFRPGYDSPWELLGEIMVAPITDGPGNVLGGPSLLLRRNIGRHCTLIPYVQVGAGIVFTDAHQDEAQRAIGQTTEFLLQAGAGVRCRLNDNWTLDLEAGFQHVSNAGAADRNGGVNAIGGLVGVTYTFPRRR